MIGTRARVYHTSHACAADAWCSRLWRAMRPRTRHSCLLYARNTVFRDPHRRRCRASPAGRQDDDREEDERRGHHAVRAQRGARGARRTTRGPLNRALPRRAALRRSTMPTQGFNIKSVAKDGFKLNVWECVVALPRAALSRARRSRARRTPLRPPQCRRPARDPALLAQLFRQHGRARLRDRQRGPVRARGAPRFCARAGA